MNFILLSLAIIIIWIIFSIVTHYYLINDKQRIIIIFKIIKKINSPDPIFSGDSLLCKVYVEYNKRRYNKFMTQLKNVPDFPDFLVNIHDKFMSNKKIDIKQITNAILFQDDLNFKKELNEYELEKRNNIINEIYEKWLMKSYE